MGVRDLYTWQTRRLRLHFDAEGVHGVVLGYGDTLTSRNKHTVEPMTAWRRSKAQEKKHGEPLVYMPREHDPGRSAWRGIASLIADRTENSQGADAAAYLRPGILEWVARLVTEGELERGFLIRARVIGPKYGTQQSVIDDIVDDHVSMAVVLLHRQDREYAQQAVGAVSDADQAVNALGDLATHLARAAGTETEGPRSTARDLAFGELESPYRMWLESLAGSDPHEKRMAWQRQVHQIIGGLGDRLMAAAGDRAWQGRTVAAKNGTEWLNSALAGRWFRAALRRCLGHDLPDSQDADQTPVSQTTVKAHA
jgi:CRISPR system Cascade subunit CasA